jgi:hypothetical protein
MTRCLSSGNRQVAFDSSLACHPGSLELRTDVPCVHSAPKGGCVSAARSRLGTRFRSQVDAQEEFEATEWLGRALLKLPFEQRTALELMHHAGYSSGVLRADRGGLRHEPSAPRRPTGCATPPKRPPRSSRREASVPRTGARGRLPCMWISSAGASAPGGCADLLAMTLFIDALECEETPGD